MFTFAHHKWDVSFICIAFIAIIVGRFMNIYPLACLLNIGRQPKIPINFMNMLLFSGMYMLICMYSPKKNPYTLYNVNINDLAVNIYLVRIKTELQCESFQALEGP